MILLLPAILLAVIPTVKLILLEREIEKIEKRIEALKNGTL